MNFQTIEAQIASEWNVVRAFIALHPWAQGAVILAVGILIGRFVL